MGRRGKWCVTPSTPYITYRWIWLSFFRGEEWSTFRQISNHLFILSLSLSLSHSLSLCLWHLTAYFGNLVTRFLILEILSHVVFSFVGHPIQNGLRTPMRKWERPQRCITSAERQTHLAWLNMNSVQAQEGNDIHDILSRIFTGQSNLRDTSRRVALNDYWREIIKKKNNNNKA